MKKEQAVKDKLLAKIEYDRHLAKLQEYLSNHRQIMSIYMQNIGVGDEFI